MSGWEQPRLWIESLEDDSLRVVPETASLLQQITRPVVVVAIAGALRTGKSYLMNRLAGQNNGFALGATVQPQTKGIWVWCLAHPCKENHVLVLIDTEGLSDPEEGNKNKDVSVFSLAVLLSSTFVFNIQGKLDQKMIDDLHLVTQLTERIKVKGSQTDDEDGNLSDFTEYLPAFVVVVRDFTLELTLHDRPVSANEYFNHVLKLKNGDGRRAFEYNLPRQAIRNSFKSHFCFTFTRPVLNEDKFPLLAENKISEADLSPRFVQQSNEFCHYVYSTSSTKTLKRGQAVSGRVLATMAEEYVKAINFGAIPCIESTVTLVAERENNRVIEDAIERYEQAMECLHLPVDVEEIDRKHLHASELATNYFSTHVIFDDKNAFMEKFLIGMTKCFDQMLCKNAEISSEKCVELINALHDSIITVNEYAKPGGYEQYCADIARVIEAYRNEPGKGAKAEEVCCNFLKDKDAERNVIMQSDSKMTAKEIELEKITNEKKIVEMEALETARLCQEEKHRNEMMERDFHIQLHTVTEQLEKQYRAKESERIEILNKRFEEHKRLMQEGFDKKADLLMAEIEQLKKEGEKKSVISHIFEAVERVIGMAPQIMAYKYMFAKTPKSK